jgi:hypothetical protein
MLAQPAAGVQHFQQILASLLAVPGEISIKLNLSAKCDTGAQIYLDTGNTGNRGPGGVPRDRHSRDR